MCASFKNLDIVQRWTRAGESFITRVQKDRTGTAQLWAVDAAPVQYFTMWWWRRFASFDVLQRTAMSVGRVRKLETRTGGSATPHRANCKTNYGLNSLKDGSEIKSFAVFAVDKNSLANVCRVMIVENVVLIFGMRQNAPSTPSK